MKARVAAGLIALALAGTRPSPAQQLEWVQLPALPDAVGVAGVFAGTSRGALIVGGGANFPDKTPWEGGVKAWHSGVYVLERPDAAWTTGLQLPRPGAYGVSLTALDGVLCVGGSDERQHLTNVFVLRWRDGRLETSALPPLPFPLAYACGAMVGNTACLAGGTDSPEATQALRKFLRLDLSRPERGWEILAPWPGPGRMLATAAALEGSFFLVGGVGLQTGTDGKPSRQYLRDGYRFHPDRGWAPIADMPVPVAAAPSPAPAFNATHFWVIGGDDGSLAGFEPKSRHPGFPRRVLRYDARQDRWQSADGKVSRATLPAVYWKDLWVLPSGEVRPGVRSPEVWAVRLSR